MSDDIRRWSEELARDPSSMVFLPLGDALRRRGQMDYAQKIATRGLERHPYDADAHDLLARIWADRGEGERAMDEWGAALRIAPHHPGSLKGMGFACFQAGRLTEAEQYLDAAAAAEPDDATIAAALDRVRDLSPHSGNGAPSRAGGANGDGRVGLAESVAESGVGSGAIEPGIADDGISDDYGGRSETNAAVARAVGAGGKGVRGLFADVVGDGEQAALLLDGQGFVLAGTYVVSDGREVAQEVGGALTGVSDEARRAMRHLGLGDWHSLVFEAEAATIAMAPLAGGPEEGGVSLVAAARTVPLGLVRRLLQRVGERAAVWMAETIGPARRARDGEIGRTGREGRGGGGGGGGTPHMTTPFIDVLDGFARQRGVQGVMVVSERDGIVVDAHVQLGVRSSVVAALAASIYRKARLSAGARPVWAA